MLNFDKEKYLSMGRLVQSKRGELEEIGAKIYREKYFFYRCGRNDGRVYLCQEGYREPDGSAGVLCQCRRTDAGGA